MNSDKFYIFVKTIPNCTSKKKTFQAVVSPPRFIVKPPANNELQYQQLKHSTGRSSKQSGFFLIFFFIFILSFNATSLAGATLRKLTNQIAGNYQ